MVVSKKLLYCVLMYISINVHLRAVLCLLCNLRPRFTVALYAKSMSVFERARAFLNTSMWVIVHICAAWGRAPEPEPNVYILNVICAREGHVWSLRSDLHICACLDRRVWCGACAMCVVSVSVPHRREARDVIETRAYRAYRVRTEKRTLHWCIVDVDALWMVYV